MTITAKVSLAVFAVLWFAALTIAGHVSIGYFPLWIVAAIAVGRLP